MPQTSDIASLLPAGVVTVTACEPDWETELLPGEGAGIERATGGRRREFAAARNCARRALARLGVRDFPILVGEAGEPIWPEGIVGSITHFADYCAAALAPAALVQGLGIDVAPNRSLAPEVRDLVCTAGERRCMGESSDFDLSMLHFSAKESVYKAWYPIARRWLDHQDVEIDVELSSGRFSARLPAAPGVLPCELDGAFTVTPSQIFTAVSVPTRRPAAR